jgi:hypothetical protein
VDLVAQAATDLAAMGPNTGTRVDFVKFQIKSRIGNEARIVSIGVNPFLKLVSCRAPEAMAQGISLLIELYSMRAQSGGPFASGM